MKAKHFKKLRQNTRWYAVEVTAGMFGSFGTDFKCSYKVLAKNARQACERLKRRGIGLDHSCTSTTTERWGHFKVKQWDAPNNHRHINFYGN